MYSCCENYNAGLHTGKWADYLRENGGDPHAVKLDDDETDGPHG
ncbi:MULTISPECIES: hypothetical protein [Sporomusa]|nr:hypothetical protein [Sporomusa sphaeroides]HML33121.1 hypothetical protein [Sporomusa sphaeroides]